MATATIIRVPRSDAQQYISPEALKYHLHEELVLKNIRRVYCVVPVCGELVGL